MFHLSIFHRDSNQVRSHALSYMRRMDAGEDIFAGLQENDNDVGGPSLKRAARVSLSPSSPSSSFNTGPWSEEEKRLFDVGVRKYGRGQWKKIAALIGTRYVMIALVA